MSSVNNAQPGRSVPAQTEGDYTTDRVEMEVNEVALEERPFELHLGAGYYQNTAGAQGVGGELEIREKYLLSFLTPFHSHEASMGFLRLEPGIKAEGHLDLANNRKGQPADHVSTGAIAIVNAHEGKPADRIDARMSVTSLFIFSFNQKNRGTSWDVSTGTIGARYKKEAALGIEQRGVAFGGVNTEGHHSVLLNGTPLDITLALSALQVILGQCTMGEDEKLVGISWLEATLGMGIMLGDNDILLRNEVGFQVNGNQDNIDGELRASNRLSLANIADTGISLFGEISMSQLSMEHAIITDDGAIHSPPDGMSLRSIERYYAGFTGIGYSY
jgi:hypothetical protein